MTPRLACAPTQTCRVWAHDTYLIQLSLGIWQLAPWNYMSVGIHQCFSGINKYNGRAQVNPRASAVNRLYLSYYSVTHCLGNDANSKRTLPACVLSACSWLSADITDCDSFFRRIRSSKKSGSWDEFTSQAKKHARSSLQLHPLILHMSEMGSSLFKFRQDQIYILRVIKTKINKI